MQEKRGFQCSKREREELPPSLLGYVPSAAQLPSDPPVCASSSVLELGIEGV